MNRVQRPYNSLLPTLLGTLVVVAVIVVIGFVARPTRLGTTGQNAAIRVVAAENSWGSVAAQLGGDRVSVTNIINNPDTDPHDYEPTAADGRNVADARYIIINGIGYDPWADKLVAASNNSATSLKIGDLVGIAPGGNPHRWYSPDDVAKVIERITNDYKKIDPADAAYFDRQKNVYETQSLKRYNSLVSEIKNKYAGVPVGASESIFSLLTPSLGLNLVTPKSFLTAMSEGTEPTATDKAAIDQQIKGKQIKMYVYNNQNSTPDVVRQVDEANAAEIPVIAITETLSPAGLSFQDWQTRQLEALRDGLAKGTGR